MRKWWHWALALLVGVGVLLGVCVPATTWMKSTVHSARILRTSRMQPVILIPGSSATQDRFNSLISTLNAQTTGHSLLKITVKTDGSLTYSGAIAAKDNEPYIVVAFQNNADGYSNIKKQAKWFSIAFKKLVATYHFHRFAAIGHSNGGLIFTLFLEKYATSDTTMTRLMSIGTPYNLEESNISNQTQMLHDLIKGNTKLPSSLAVYSLAGTETLTGDGTVPLASVEAGKYIFQNQVKHYTQITVSGNDAGHSDLPQNRQIISYIRQYMLTTPNQPGIRITTDGAEHRGVGPGVE